METALLYLVIGLAVGAALGWLVKAQSPEKLDLRVEDELRERAKRAEQASTNLQQSVDSLGRANSDLQANLKFTNEQLATERQNIEAIQEKFRKDFEAISNKLLLESSKHFNQQSSESIDKLLAPFRQTLGEFKASLEKNTVETASSTALLKNEIARIGAEAANLTRALKGDVKVLGNWGENMLDQLLEKSGLQRDLHYRRQVYGRGPEGEKLILDVLIALPDNRHLIVDSKVSLRDYEMCVNCAEEIPRAQALKNHVDALRRHFRGLGGKRYQETHGVSAPDFVLMYIPIEGAFTAAVSADPAIFSDALNENVVLITNSTLLATLRTVAHVWRLAEQQKNVVEIAERGGRLYDKFVGFVEDLVDVENALKKAQTALDGATNKLSKGQGSLVWQAQQLKTLGAKAAKSLPSSLLDRADETEPILSRLETQTLSTLLSNTSDSAKESAQP